MEKGEGVGGTWCEIEEVGRAHVRELVNCCSGIGIGYSSVIDEG